MKIQTTLKLQWLLCIEYMYIYLCSFFPIEILRSMKWYVGESMIYDYTYHEFRNKQFYIQWGLGSLMMFIDYVSFQHSKAVQYHQLYIEDTSRALNTM